MIRPVVQLGDPVLRQRAHKVNRVDDSITRLIEDLIDSMHEAHGSGLAAPQIGVPLRVIITNIEDDLRVLVNPEITSRSSETEIADEGCLSIKGFAGPVERSLRVQVRALNEKGKKVKIKADEWFARCLQHEVDHLDGILYIDRIEDKSQIVPVNENYEVEPEHGMAEIMPSEGAPETDSSTEGSGPKEEMGSIAGSGLDISPEQSPPSQNAMSRPP